MIHFFSQNIFIMKFIASLFVALVFQASQVKIQCSAYRILSAPKYVSTIRSQEKSQNRISPLVGTFAASMLPRPKLANAIGGGSRVPLPTTLGGLELATIIMRVARTAILFSWTLLIVVAFEWRGFEYFRHLACKIRDLGKEDEEMVDVGLAKEIDWSAYSHLIYPLQKKKQVRFGARIGNLFRRLNYSKGVLSLFSHTIIFPFQLEWLFSGLTSYFSCTYNFYQYSNKMYTN